MEEKEYPPDSIESKVVDVLKTCYDPEIPVDIYQLGLIYDVAFDEEKGVQITMTLTSPACPVAGTLPPEIQQKVIDQIEDVTEANVEVVWDPPWSTDLMSEAAKLQLGMM
jgi:FeS assembly SUF system protein